MFHPPDDLERGYLQHARVFSLHKQSSDVTRSGTVDTTTCQYTCSGAHYRYLPTYMYDVQIAARTGITTRRIGSVSIAMGDVIEATKPLARVPTSQKNDKIRAKTDRPRTF